MLLVKTFSELEECFLQPLIEKQQLRVEQIPLKDMTRWEVSDQTVRSAFFEIQGQRVTFEQPPRSTEPASWDQPIYHQGSGTLFCIVDEDKNILIQALFEPGNTGRGYQQRGLVLSSCCKFSPENLVQQHARGRMLPFAEILNHPEAKLLFQCEAPGDGGRANKQNKHFLIQVPRTTLETIAQALPALDKDYYVLVPLTVLKDCYRHALANEHLRDLTSLLMFLE